MPTYAMAPVAPPSQDPPQTLVKDGAMFIPCDLANRDYQEFLLWLADGNPAPEGWTGPTNPPPEAA